MVFAQFPALSSEVAAIKTVQQRQAAATAGLSSATAAGLNGLAATGSTASLSAEQINMLDSMKVQLEGLVAS